MRVWVNGRALEVCAGTTVADVLVALSAPASGVAVAVDGEVVRRADWAARELAAEDAVEVLTAVQGG